MVYHKPTHTDQCSQWDSHHNLSAKYSVIGTLTHRAKSVCPALELLDEELQHLKRALVRCRYHGWAINKEINKVINGNQEDSGTTQLSNSAQDNTGTNTGDNNQVSTLAGRPSTGHIVIPYIQGLGESIKCTCSKYGIRTHFKFNRTLKQILVKPKDKDPEEKNFTRLIKESIFIRVNNPRLNRNIGKFQLSHIWDRVLLSTPGIKVAIPQGNVHNGP